MSDREQRELERARHRERERRRRGSVSQPERQPGQEPHRRPTARRTATATAPAQEPARGGRDRGSGRDSEREGERDGRRERERQRPTRDPTHRDSHRQSRSNPPPAPVTATTGAGITGTGTTDRRESTRDPGRRHSRRDRGDLRGETVRLVPRDAEASEGLVRGGTRRRSHSARERESGGIARVGSNRNPQRERSRRERATVPADSYDRRQAEMRARYQPVPQVLAPEPAIAHGPIFAGWGSAGDGSADAEKGNGADSAGLLSDKRASSGSGMGLLQNGGKKKVLWRRPCFWALAAVGIILFIILVSVGVLVSKKHKPGSDSSSSDAVQKQGLQNIDPSSIPASAKGTYYDPFDWLDTTDFNCTYTNETVGGLPIMGLFSEWDDSTQANSNVPPLNKPFNYGKQPVRGVNVGGWFVLEPFISPSLFNHWDSSLGIVDEYTLSQHLGPNSTRQTLEQHYSTFITEDDFRMIQEAGLDHVRIPYGYWAAMKLDGDPFLYQVQWRYLLRAIEWCRKYGLRVNLDLHSVPGGANGWNHSGRQGPINWLRGPDGQKNGNLTLTLHDQLSTFFAQPRYQNIVTFYGLVNEPRMTTLDPATVIAWSAQAFDIIRGNGYNGKIVFGDGFRGLFKWKGSFAGLDGMVLDVHQYVIFNTGQLAMSHSAKVQFSCQAWAQQLSQSLDTNIGFGPTIVGEWGQADTDCTPFLNNVGMGNRWEGTLNYGANSPGNVLTPICPNQKQCSCAGANADPGKYPDAYKLFLKTFAIAQMDAFEKGWGWIYWTWQTEAAYQWSYRKGLDAGILPASAVNREWSCSSPVPDFASQGLPENY